MTVSVTRYAFIQREYRTTPELTDATVKARDGLATEMVYNTLIEKGTDAQEFQQEILDLRRISRYDWQLGIKRDVYSFSLGDTITIFYPRYGFQAGANFIVKRIRRDHKSGFMQLTLFGPQ